MEGDAEGAVAVASQALACAMRIIAGVLHGHVSNCVDFCDSKGPSALSWLLVNKCGTLLRDINLSASVGVVGAVAALLGAVAASRELTLAAAVNRRSGGGGGGRPQVRRSKASSAAVPVESIVLSLQHRMVEQLLGPGTWRAASAALQVNTTTSLVLIKSSLSLMTVLHHPKLYYVVCLLLKFYVCYLVFTFFFFHHYYLFYFFFFFFFSSFFFFFVSSSISSTWRARTRRSSHPRKARSACSSQSYATSPQTMLQLTT